MSKETSSPDHEKSPFWGPTTKLVVALILAAISIALFVSIRPFLGPVLIAIILSYLVYPWAVRLHRLLHIPWRLITTLIYLLTLGALLSLLTWGGIALVEQIQNLINFLQGAINGLPDFIAKTTAQPQVIGPFTLDWSRLDIATLINQLLGIVQPILNQAGTLVGTIATSAASIVGWTIFSFVLSYFIVSEVQGNPSRLSNLKIPGYGADVERIKQELSIIWNAFLRGQLILFTLTATIYTVTLGILGVRYYFGLALLAGFARFLPYIGPVISWTTDGIVAFSQGYTIFGLAPEQYTLLVLCTAWVTDAVIDNLISPRIFSKALRIHPAAVMVTAIVGFNLMGMIGIVLAAPVLATLKLLLDYIIRKLLDIDPWADFERTPPPVPIYVMVIQYAKITYRFIRIQYDRFRIRFIRWRKQRTGMNRSQFDRS